MFEALGAKKFAAIYADPPWQFNCWADSDKAHGTANSHYSTMSPQEIQGLPIGDLAAKDCCLFLWICWPNLVESLEVIKAWGFTYKTCAFSWIKGDARQVDFFQEELVPYMGLGYWTRANSEVCLLATKGKPSRLVADVRQAIVEPRRQHSRKPDCVYERIERLVSGPYLELFARTTRPGWSSWGNQVGKFAEVTN